LKKLKPKRQDGFRGQIFLTDKTPVSQDFLTKMLLFSKNIVQLGSVVGTRKATLALLLVLTLVFVSFPQIKVDAQAKMIVVPDDFPTIQEAIDNANEGDTVFVKRRTYNNQALNIDKSLSLIGEDTETTILKGNEIPSDNLRIITIEADDVKISGFTITEGYFGISGQGERIEIIGNKFSLMNQNAISLGGSFKTIVDNDFIFCPTSIQSSGFYNNISRNNMFDWGDRGILVGDSYSIISENNFVNIRSQIVINGNSNIISGNTGTIDGYDGIIIESGFNNTIFGNSIVGNTNTAIKIYNGHNNTIYENYLAENNLGIFIGGITEYFAENNIFYNNNFVNNTQNVRIDKSIVYINYWDFSSKGNYWSNYNGTDNNGDGIGDTPYIIDENNQDNFPLIEPVPTIPEFSSWTILIAGLSFVAVLSMFFRHKFKQEREK
jgi:nitrous oxidase accessory protein